MVLGNIELLFEVFTVRSSLRFFIHVKYVHKADRELVSF